MPYSQKQQNAARMAEHASPEELEKAGPAVKQMAETMTHDQLHDFSTQPIKHKHKKHHKPHEDKGGGGRKANPRGGSY